MVFFKLMMAGLYLAPLLLIKKLKTGIYTSIILAFIVISILLISKIPTYSLKKIVVPRSATIFLLLFVVLYFGLLLIYTFNTMIISGLLYLLIVPVSTIHYFKIIKNKKIDENNIDHHEDVL